MRNHDIYKLLIFKKIYLHDIKLQDQSSISNQNSLKHNFPIIDSNRPCFISYFSSPHYTVYLNKSILETKSMVGQHAIWKQVKITLKKTWLRYLEILKCPAIFTVWILTFLFFKPSPLNAIKYRNLRKKVIIGVWKYKTINRIKI